MTPSHKEPLKPESVEETFEFHTANTLFKIKVSKHHHTFLSELDKFLYEKGMRGSYKNGLLKHIYDWLICDDVLGAQATAYIAGRSSMRQDIITVVKNAKTGWYEAGEGLDIEYSAEEFRSELLTNIEGIV